MSNIEHSGSFHSARVRRSAIALGPLSFLRTNRSSQAIDIKLARTACCNPTQGCPCRCPPPPVLTEFTFDNFNKKFNTSLSPCQVDLTPIFTYPPTTVTLNIVGNIQYPFQFNTFTDISGNVITYPNGLKLILLDQSISLFLYVVNSSSVATTENPFVPTSTPNLYTYIYTYISLYSHTYIYLYINTHNQAEEFMRHNA